MNEDIFGFATGTTAGAAGAVVDMGDGVFIPTQDFRTVRLPEEHGGHWVAVIDTDDLIIGGYNAKAYLLAGDVSVISIHGYEGGTQLWVATKQIEHWFANEEE